MQSLKAATFAVLGLLVSLAGCSRQTTVLTPDQRSGSGQQLPFASLSAKSGVSPTAELTTNSLPPGTLLTVRVQSPVSSASSLAGDAFEAVVDDPIVIDGQTLVPRGTKTKGRVLAAKASGGPNEAGYLRLMLTAISLNGKSISLETSSIFAKAESPDREDSRYVATASAANEQTEKEDVNLPAKARLTFRLTQTLTISN